MFFFNYNSFLLLLLLAWVIALAAVTRARSGRRGWLVFGGITLLLAAGYFALRPAESTSEQAEGIRSQIGQGSPVLLEFQSQN